MFKYTLDNKRYHTLNYFYKNKFGIKVFKVSLNGGFSCPNLDGRIGYGGCIYCSKSGSGEFGGDIHKSLTEQFMEIKEVVNKRHIPCKYIGYFQARTNTYAPVDVLRKKYEEVLKIDDVIGLNIATRCDAISDECLNYLEELNKRTFLTIELGLQTIHKKTTEIINRCHTLDEFDEMVPIKNFSSLITYCRSIKIKLAVTVRDGKLKKVTASEKAVVAKVLRAKKIDGADAFDIVFL